VPGWPGIATGWEQAMADLVMIVMIVIFFGLCVSYVAACDRIIGPDPARIDTTARELEQDVAA
jgi:hypothetical protein